MHYYILLAAVHEMFVHFIREKSGAITLTFSNAQVMNLIGDVRGKVAVMVDDMIDTAG